MATAPALRPGPRANKCYGSTPGKGKGRTTHRRLQAKKRNKVRKAVREQDYQRKQERERKRRLLRLQLANIRHAGCGTIDEEKEGLAGPGAGLHLDSDLEDLYSLDTERGHRHGSGCHCPVEEQDGPTEE